MSEGSPAVLAIDGGNSKTDVALVAADGTLLGQVRGPGTDSQHDGIGPTMRKLAALVAAVAKDAQPAVTRDARPAVTRDARPAVAQDARPADPARDTGPADPARDTRPADPVGSLVATHISACLANADLPDEEEELGAALAAQGWALTSSLINDTFAVLRAGLHGPEHWGVAVTCGAGINCVGVAPDGRTTRFLALGEATGDWGGGMDLGMQSLWWAMRAEDGRGPQTMLRQAVAEHFGVREVRDVAIGIHRRTFARNQLLGLPPVLFELAGRGDDVARDLVTRLADEVCLMVLATIRRLGLAGQAVPVVLGGGLLTARNPLVTESIVGGLAAVAPGAVMRIVDVPPVAGAALLGLDHVGAGLSAERRLRAAYTGPATVPAHETAH